jgi:hypothetical protein
MRLCLTRTPMIEDHMAALSTLFISSALKVHCATQSYFGSMCTAQGCCCMFARNFWQGNK